MDHDEFGSVTLDTNPGFQSFGFAGGFQDRLAYSTLCYAGAALHVTCHATHAIERAGPAFSRLGAGISAAGRGQVIFFGPFD